ncbi:PREDICTED: uncharacterized protein LOC104598178 [Nelumbo nucifera]|uniref:Uncharacterized protein LOC104598178 n=1 Tax=Nelumbo nucifera TaxID=4432 RepID=A0A1U8Q485_NELNU|nr:PREDICTED: uncharacterized protein LOC104598178 [Nelumbo nucifera]
MGWLLMTLIEPVLAQVIGCTSSRSVWIILEQLYASKSRVRVMQLHFELRCFKKGALSVPQYLQKVKNLTDNLIATGEPLFDTDYILTILSGLDLEYESFITAVTTRVDAYTVEDVKGMLLNQKIRLGQIKGSHGSLDSNYPVANMAVRGNANFNNINDSHNFSKGNKSYPQSSKPQYKCQICWGKNHSAFKCKYKFDRNFERENFKQQKQAFHVSTDSSCGEAWYPDSGAMNHLTADLANLNVHSEYTGPDQLRIRNGSVGQFSTNNNVYFEFHPHVVYVKDLLTKKVLLQGVNKSGLYKLSNSHNMDTHSPFAARERTNIDVWHRRLGHPAPKRDDTRLSLILFVTDTEPEALSFSLKLKTLKSESSLGFWMQFVEMHHPPSNPNPLTHPYGQLYTAQAQPPSYSHYLYYPHHPQNPSLGAPQTVLKHPEIPSTHYDLGPEPGLRPPGIDSYAALNQASQVGTPTDAAYYPDTCAAAQNWAAKEAVRQFGADPVAYAAGGIRPPDQLLIVNPNPANWGNSNICPPLNGGWKKGSKKTKIVQSAWCEVCKIDCNSKDVLYQHKLGKKHRKNLEKLEAAKKDVNAPAIAPMAKDSVIGPKENLTANKGKSVHVQQTKKKAVPSSTSGEDLETKRRKVVEGGAAPGTVKVCTVCNMVCNSQTIFNYHVAGQKHITKLKKHATTKIRVA